MIAGFLTPWVVYLLALMLHLVLPSRQVEGYIKDPASSSDNKPYVYHLNGIWVCLFVVLVWFLLGRFEILPWDWCYRVRWSSLAGAFSIGFLYSLQLVLNAVPSSNKSFLCDLFLGRTQNLHYFQRRVDAKMYLYLAGAVMLELNVLSCVAHYQILFGKASNTNPAIWVHAVLLSFFVLDYLIFEHVHVYTYDIFAERLGIKLAWGCLCFYPYFYAIGLWSTVGNSPSSVSTSSSTPWLIMAVLLFFSGWILSRGSNLQKYTFKRFPSRVFLGVIRPTVLCDKHDNYRILCSGFWGIARHVNYLGEILMATGLALAVGQHHSLSKSNPWPWMYPLYYILLLIPRERDDDRRCSMKYRKLWDQYREIVPYRIVPGVY